MVRLSDDEYAGISGVADSIAADLAAPAEPAFNPWGTAADAAAASSEIDTSPSSIPEPAFSPWDSTPGSMIGVGAASAGPEPIWRDTPDGGGYWDDLQGHYSNNGGASWDYNPASTPAP